MLSERQQGSYFFQKKETKTGQAPSDLLFSCEKREARGGGSRHAIIDERAGSHSADFAPCMVERRMGWSVRHSLAIGWWGHRGTEHRSVKVKPRVGNLLDRRGMACMGQSHLEIVLPI